MDMLNICRVLPMWMETPSEKINFFAYHSPKKITAEENFQVTSEYLEQGGLQWDKCVSVCTDGAAALVGCTKGFVSRMRARNPDVVVTHCFLHHKELAKTLSADLTDVLDGVVPVLNFVKRRWERSIRPYCSIH